jgi:hypothetical protein
VLTDDFVTVLDKKLLSAPVVRDLDWRNDEPKSCRTNNSKRAAYVQQSGVKAPVGEACANCGSGSGPFDSCVVQVVKGEIVFSGACASCNFNSGGKNCSFREFSCPFCPECLLTN